MSNFEWEKSYKKETIMFKLGIWIFAVGLFALIWMGRLASKARRSSDELGYEESNKLGNKFAGIAAFCLIPTFIGAAMCLSQLLR